MYISPEGLQKLASVFDPKDPLKNVLWTADYRLELPIRMGSEGAAAEPPNILQNIFTEQCKKHLTKPALSVKRGGKW